MNNMMSHTRRYICGARNRVIFAPGIHKPVTRFGTQPSPQHPSRQSGNQRAAKSSNGFGYSGGTGIGRCCCQPYFCRCPHHTDDRDSDTGNMPCGGDVFYCFGITVPLVQFRQLFLRAFFRHPFVLTTASAGLFVLRHPKTKMQQCPPHRFTIFLCQRLR